MEKKTIKDLKRENTLPLVQSKSLRNLRYGSEENIYLKQKPTVLINGLIPIMKYSGKVTRKFTLISPSNHQRYGTEKI